jgi:hypothetical protein
MRARSWVSPQALVMPRISTSGLVRARPMAKTSSTSSPMSESMMILVGCEEAVCWAEDRVPVKRAMIVVLRIERIRLSELRFVGDILFAAQYGAMELIYASEGFERSFWDGRG